MAPQDIYDSIPNRLFNRAKTHAFSPAFHVRENGSWIPTNYRSYAAQVRSAAKALRALGVDAGGAVSILGFNRPEWIVMELAAMTIGAVAVGIYTTSSPEEVQYVVSHSESSVILVENDHQWQKVKEFQSDMPKLKHVVMMGNNPPVDGVITWEDFNAKGEQIDDADIDAHLAAIQPDGLATLIYTSGTTGPPKGVMLSHDNLAFTSDVVLNLIKYTDSDSGMSYLPLSHIAEQMLSVCIPITGAGSIYFAESLDLLAENLREVQPSIFFAVPRVWEKFQAKVSEKLAGATGVKKGLVDFARSTAREIANYKNRGESPPLALKVKYKIANKLVLSKLKPALGLGKARYFFSAAAPIGIETIEFFATLDIPISEVYGQSEDCGPTTINLPGKRRFGTVGGLLPGIDVKTAEDDEILVKGRNVFMGYYKDQAATDETLKDGWLYSGDLGSFDEDGFLTITGRKKDIIITAGGKNVAPKNIEASLKDHPLINEAVVIGDRKKYLTALVTIDEESLTSWQTKHQSLDGPYFESKIIRDDIQKHIDNINDKLAQVETVKKFTVLPRNFSIDDGELTPTLKIKRKNVSENFSDTINSMYS